MPEIWAGLDIGKKHHHAVVVDADGKRLLSRRVMNDESELLQLIADVLEISREVLWAVDINTGIAALATGLLLNHGQPVAYLTGRTIHQASTTYRGEGKTDARDAFIIADQARIRRDVSMLSPGDDIALDLRLLTARRLDVVHDRTRQMNTTHQFPSGVGKAQLRRRAGRVGADGWSPRSVRKCSLILHSRHRVVMMPV